MSNNILFTIEVQGTEEQNAKIGELKVSITSLSSEIKKLTQQQIEATKAGSANTAELGKAITQRKQDIANMQEQIKSITQKVQATKYEEGSIMQLRQALAQATKQYDLMGAAERTAAGGKALETSIQDQMKALSALEQKTGRFQRNVGNYASGFNGLSNSINQVTRELPNFAQSATIGFMALSNNLPILADEIKRVVDANRLLQAEGKATTSVIGQIAKGIFNWQSLLITAISLSVIYAKEIANIFSNTKELSDAQKKLNDEMQKTNDIISQNTNKFILLSGQYDTAEEAYQNYIHTLQSGLDEIDKVYKEKLIGIRENSDKEKQIITDWTKEREAFVLKSESEQNSKALSLAQQHLENTEKLKLESIKNDRNRDLKLAEYEKEKSLKQIPKGADTREKDVARNAILEEYRAKVTSINIKYDEIDDKLNEEALAKAKKLKEEHDKLMIDLQRKYEDSKLEVIKNEIIRNQQIELERYDREISDLVEQRRLVGETDLKLRKEYDLLIEQKASEHQKKLDEIALPQMEGKASSTGGKIDLVKGKGTFSKDRSKEFEEEQKNRKLAIDAAINAAKQTVDAISQIKQQAIDRDLKRQLTAIQRASDGEDRILENRLKNGIISEGQYNDAKQKLNQETAAKELAANRKAFEEKKRLDTATAIANGALAVTSILAQYPKFDYGIAAAIAIGAAVATTATQVAVIQAQKFALGGKVDGKSHAQGGVMIEAEGGEGMINKNSMQSQQVMSVIGTPSQIASAINTTGGGISWEAGATLRPNPNLFSNSTSSQSITYAQMDALLRSHAASINDKKVIILESELTKTQNKVKSYEANGRF